MIRTKESFSSATCENERTDEQRSVEVEGEGTQRSGTNLSHLSYTLLSDLSDPALVVSVLVTV